MTDGLYLNNVWVAQVETALTLQANDLTKPDTLSASYSLDFSLPDTLAIRELLQNAEQLDSGGVYPYRTLSARLYQQGELLFAGIARLRSFSAGWKVNLLSATKDLFTLLGDTPLRSLDLSRLDHPWTIPVISTLAGAEEGVVYPLIDYGHIDVDSMASDGIFPAVYAHTLIRAMLARFNYRPGGDWLSEALIRRVALPFVDDQPQSRDADWVDDRTARVTVGPASPTNPIFFPGRPLDLNPIPFIIDNDPDNNFTDGKQNNFKPNLHAYVADVAMRLRVQALQQFFVHVDFGAVELSLEVRVNGQHRVEQYWSVSGPYNITGTKTDTIELDEMVSLRAGDQVTLRLYYRRRSVVAQGNQVFTLTPDTCWASFTPDPTVQPGDYWPVARNLPDLSCGDMLKSVALLTCSTFQVDELRRTVKLIPLDSVVAKTAEATDWSTRVDESEESELFATLEPYAQSNHLKWKEVDKISPYGNGIIKSPASTLPAKVDLFELLFAACLPSEKSITNYGPPVAIITRTLSNGQLTRQSTAPRLILIEDTKTVSVQANVLTPEGTVRPQPVTLTACWWGPRPVGAVADDNSISLAFSRVATTQREQTLIARYFSGLTRVLRRPRMLELSMMLYPDDIAGLDLTLPIRLHKVRIGALDVSNAYFYLNQIANYSPGQSTRVQLIPYF